MFLVSAMGCNKASLSCVIFTHEKSSARVDAPASGQGLSWCLSAFQISYCQKQVHNTCCRGHEFSSD